MTQVVRILGIPWYEREDYGAIRRVMTDSHQLPATFHEWLMKAETAEKKYRREGHTVVRALIDSKSFPDWCRSRGLNVDAKARTQFANLVAKQHASCDGRETLN